MSVLLAKILLAPLFVMGASLTARRFGARIGGLVGGLPMVAGPILLVFALDHGRAFAANASAGALLGIVSLAGFIVVYALVAQRVRWGLSLPVGWLGFFAMTAVLNQVSVALGIALLLALAALALTLAIVPRPENERKTSANLPAWDLPLRGLSALALVLALTGLAGQLGPKLSGLLAPFPVVGSVLAVFTHVQHGEQDLLRIMRGFVVGLVAYSLFCFTLTLTLRSLTTGESFALATLAALIAQATMLTVTLRRQAPAPESV